MTTLAQDTRKDIYLPSNAEVVEVREMTQHEKFFTFRLSNSEQRVFKPGQFMEVSVPCVGEAPISISSSPTRSEDGTMDMVVRKAGNVTNAMHAMSPGDLVGMRGPFGTSFPVEGAMLGQDLMFVCGGIGLVPVRSAIQYVLDHRENYGKIAILIGTRRPSDRLFTDELAAWAAEPDVQVIETVDAADRNWTKNVGVITTLFKQVTFDPLQTIAIICGPPVMYRFVLLELWRHQLAASRTYLSLERRMKCGVGKCGHCQINGIYACQEGPVVNVADTNMLQEAI